MTRQGSLLRNCCACRYRDCGNPGRHTPTECVHDIRTSKDKETERERERKGGETERKRERETETERKIHKKREKRKRAMAVGKLRMWELKVDARLTHRELS